MTADSERLLPAVLSNEEKTLQTNQSKELANSLSNDVFCSSFTKDTCTQNTGNAFLNGFPCPVGAAFLSKIFPHQLFFGCQHWGKRSANIASSSCCYPDLLYWQISKWRTAGKVAESRRPCSHWKHRESVCDIITDIHTVNSKTRTVRLLRQVVKSSEAGIWNCIIKSAISFVRPK